MNIMITGGAGGIGSTLALMLKKKGYDVIAVDNFNNGYPENLKENGRYFCEVLNMDIRDTNRLKEAMDFYKIDVIVHLAALTSLPACESNPSECIDVNVAGTASVLNAARLSKGQRVIAASTSAIYENNDRIEAPFTENLKVNPRLFYPLSKKLMEEVIESYIKNYGMDIITLRFFNVFGPRQDIHRPSPPLINYIVREYYHKRPMTFFSDGMQQRDYVHVDDVVDLIERCLDKANERLPGSVMNVCTKTLTSVRDIISCAEKAFETKLDYRFEKPKKYWGNYISLYEGLPLSESVIEKEVNKFALGSFCNAFLATGWRPNQNIEKLMIETMRQNYELIAR